MIEQYKLGNGLRIVTEKMDHVKSVTIGVWVKSGVVNENRDQNGIAHFVEHMLFKGTHNRSARQIAEEIDRVGGQINAYTSREYTCYYIKILDEHVLLAIDILMDMLFFSVFDESEIEKEKMVIFEEINMYEDSPEDLTHDLLVETMLSNHTLGLPILGTIESVDSLNSQKLKSYMSRVYHPSRMVISIAGNFDNQMVLKNIEDHLGRWNTAIDTITEPNDLKTLTFGNWTRYKEIEQSHICIGVRGVSLGSDDLYDLLLVNNTFGASMSSRLFQSIREEKGLTYDIYSYLQNYSDVGLINIYFSVNPEQISIVKSHVLKEINKLRKRGLTHNEFIDAKAQLKGSCIIGMESTSSRMAMLGKSELMLNEIETQEDVLNKINSISYCGIHEAIERYFNYNEMASVIVGKDM
ncbi:M16 family metallopeptidase [Tindallia californiensis]|uniref:Predicted Zn-dependent peptidase n=1 Tax=Tindallia californiensis TaxID=159292 RepID=A0A1H3NQJ1_9FIRM|nr:pitrilysin family protein [Tindallia californiensis]SDY90439.1 Predicted Zn-dependent peptidase [Tindallia californiensis]